MSKRISSRGIILNDDSVLTIFRRKKKKDGTFKEYYTIPGGGLEENESLEENVLRELNEELCINVKILGYLGKEERENSIDNYFHCELIDGDLKIGGEEKDRMSEDNYYEVRYVKIKDLDKIDIFGIDMIKRAINKEYTTI